MKSHVLHTVWCNISGEAAGEIWNWSLLGVKGSNCAAAWLTQRQKTDRCSYWLLRYGDIYPKSVQARLYSIVWMLIGMVAFSLLTANITNSLTYAIESDMRLYGKIVSGSSKQHVLLHYIRYTDMWDIGDMRSVTDHRPSCGPKVCE